MPKITKSTKLEIIKSEEKSITKNLRFPISFWHEFEKAIEEDVLYQSPTDFFRDVMRDYIASKKKDLE